MGPYVDVHRLFQRKEKWALCEAALMKHGEMTTRELAAYFVGIKGFDPSDGVLLQAITFQLVQSLRMQAKRGRVAMIGKRKGICVWRTDIGTMKRLI